MNYSGHGRYNELPQQVLVSLPADTFDLDDFEGSVLEVDVALSALRKDSVSIVLRDLALFLDELGIVTLVLRRPELYGSSIAIQHLLRHAPEAAVHVALGEAHRLKYLKRFWNVFAPVMSRNMASLKATSAFFQDCYRSYANTTGYLAGHLPLHTLRSNVLGEPVGLLPRVEHIRLAMRAKPRTGRVEGCRIIPCYFNTYSPPHAVYVTSLGLGSAWETSARLSRRLDSRPKLVTIVDPLADIPTPLGKAIVDLAHLELVGEQFLFFIIVEDASDWDEQKILALHQRLTSSLLAFGEGHHVLSPDSMFLVFPSNRVELARFLGEMDALLGMEPGFLDSPANQLGIALGLRLLSFAGDCVSELLPRLARGSVTLLEHETHVWGLSDEPVQRWPTEFRVPAPGALRTALKVLSGSEQGAPDMQRRRENFSASIVDVGAFFSSFAKMRRAQ
jgi:hypothetical protein